MPLIFNDEISFSIIEEDKSYNYNEEYIKKYRLNRVLAKMEDFFRAHHLLEKTEMLDISHHPQKHIRIGFIEHISLKKNWIYPDEFVHILPIR